MTHVIKNKLRILYLIATLLLIGLFFFPLWMIKLEAAQYPEGITMYIWLNKITGNDPNTLNSVNILNHYIGMQKITPESIPELKYFPFVNLFLIISGIGVFLANKRSLRLSWLIILVILATLGIYDFYLWEYDYGHNLDPNAPIKVPGMVYQPPLLGVKWLLNFKAFSFPHVGGILMGISILIATLGSLFEFNILKTKRKAKKFSSLLLIPVFFMSCDIHPQPIAYGQDSCGQCSMVIMDQRYGTEAVTDKGRILKFDSIECLVNYLLKNQEEKTGFEYLLITGYTNPGTLTNAKEASYLISKNMPSPMGAFLTGFSSYEEATKHQEKNGGALYTWEELVKHFEKK